MCTRVDHAADHSRRPGRATRQRPVTTVCHVPDSRANIRRLDAAEDGFPKIFPRWQTRVSAPRISPSRTVLATARALSRANRTAQAWGDTRPRGRGSGTRLGRTRVGQGKLRMSARRRGEAEAKIKGTLLFALVIGLFAGPLPAESDPVRVLFVGDVMMAHRLKPVLEARGSDYPFRGLASFLKEADLVFGNLENPIGASGVPSPDQEYRFLMAPARTAALRAAGFRVMSVANNHILDYGPSALHETLVALREHGIAACGAGENLAAARQPAVVTVRGYRLAFLCYSRSFPLSFSATPQEPGAAFADLRIIREDVAAARSNSDWVFVSLHWGKEYSSVPTAAQRRLARAVIDAGADGVIGHHPHTPQGVELYRGRVIAYSLGNFVFGTLNRRADWGLALRITLGRDKTHEADIFPIWTDNHRVGYQPRFLLPDARREKLRRLQRLSAAWGTRLAIHRDRASLRMTTEKPSRKQAPSRRTGPRHFKESTTHRK
jgi:poly-gamma-glutamate capsule biosynthesis protein CapA/YwtB (metallophosphatase superfamily)